MLVGSKLYDFPFKMVPCQGRQFVKIFRVVIHPSFIGFRLEYYFGITLQQDLDIPTKNSEKDTHLPNYSKSTEFLLV